MTNVPNCAAINGFLAAPAQSRFIMAFLDHVLGNIRDAGERGIFWLSGPGAMTSFLHQNPDWSDVGLIGNATLKSDYFKQFDAPYKHTPLNWRVFEHERGLGNADGLRQVLEQVTSAPPVGAGP